MAPQQEWDLCMHSLLYEMHNNGNMQVLPILCQIASYIHITCKKLDLLRFFFFNPGKYLLPVFHFIAKSLKFETYLRNSMSK